MRQGRVAKASSRGSRGAAPTGALQNGSTKVWQSYMEQLEVSVPDWYNDAECSRHPEELFHFETKRDKPKLLRGVKICNTCIAKKECLEAASPGDRYWSVRGGLLPDAVFSGPKPKVPNHLEGEAPRRKCPRGHERWGYSRSTKKWFCRACESARQKAYRRGEKLEPIQKPTHCPRGHDDWNYDGNGHRRCRECRRMENRIRRESGSGILPPATM